MNVTLFADWTPAMVAAAFTALKAHCDNMVGKVHYCTQDTPMIGWSRVMRGELQAAFISGYVFVYDVGPSWGTTKNILYELILAKATPEGEFEDLVKGLRHLAAIYDCYAIEVSNGALRPGLRRLYERAGFIKTNETYTLEV